MSKPSTFNLSLIFSIAFLPPVFSQNIQKSESITNNKSPTDLGKLIPDSNINLAMKIINYFDERQKFYKDLSTKLNETANYKEDFKNIRKSLDELVNKDSYTKTLKDEIIKIKEQLASKDKELSNSILECRSLKNNKTDLLRLNNDLKLEKDGLVEKYDEINDKSIFFRLFPSDYKRIKYFDWLIVITCSVLLLVLFKVFVKSFVAIRYVSLFFSNAFFRKARKPFTHLKNKIDIIYDLIPNDFDNASWSSIISEIKNTGDSTLWCDDFRKEFYELLQKETNISIEDLAFFLCNVWAKYVFLFEHDIEAWKWSSKIIKDSLPANLNIEFKVRLPNIGASHTLTTRSGITLSTTGSGPKITKIIHPGCEFIRIADQKILCSMPASVEMGD
jgi:hypothetical protein